MKFVDLLSIIDEDTHIIIGVGDNSVDRIELDADNSFLKLFDDCKILSIFAQGLYIDVCEVGDE